MVKTAVLELLDSPKLISRKISHMESQSLHSVEKREIYLHTYEKYFVKAAHNNVLQSVEKSSTTISVFTEKSRFFPSNQQFC